MASGRRDTARKCQENLELVRDLLEAFRRRDHERAFGFTTPTSCGSITTTEFSGVYDGHEGVRAWARVALGMARPSVEIQDVRDEGDR